jgi:hypothetical protein
MDWQAIGKQLAALGLPLLGGALGGPAGAVVGKGIAAALGLGADATPEQAAAALGNMSGEQLVAIRALEADMFKAQLASDTERNRGQVELLKIDGEKGSAYQKGWRPGAGWICVFGLGYTFFLRPLLPWVLQVSGVHGVPVLPPIDTTELFVLLGGLLGLGGMRTTERIKGKA